MDKRLLAQLSQITEEEKKILEGSSVIDASLYFNDQNSVIDSHKLLDSGKLIKVRTHTRFVHFPKHRHNFIEMIYMYSGSTTHIINGSQITLNQGELLILNQYAVQEIEPANEHDIAINFIILPEFFDQSLIMLGTENSPLRNFIIGCLKSEEPNIPYLHFRTASVLPVQNLVENLAWTLVNETQHKRQINQITMGLLFLQLMNHTDTLSMGQNNYEQDILMNVLQYIEEHYKDGELRVLADKLGYEFTWLSRTIKKLTGSTYTELVQKKRLNQACFLLKTTRLSVLDISLAVGYDNFSYFHRIFKKAYGMSPRIYRISESTS